VVATARGGYARPGFDAHDAESRVPECADWSVSRLTGPGSSWPAIAGKVVAIVAVVLANIVASSGPYPEIRVGVGFGIELCRVTAFIETTELPV